MTFEEWLGKDNQLGIDIWQKKYQHNGENFEQWLDRICNGNETVKQLVREKKFLFGGRILSNRGVNDSKVTYSNCYVIEPPEDNIESIFESRKKLARTYSYGGGAGIDLSKLSPAGAKVNNQAKQTSGAVSFMQGYSQITEEIGQNGRRGALMISLDCHHPDLPEFIDVKTKNGAVERANISVRITDDFMQAVENNEDWHMTFTRKETGEKIERVMPARELFNKLCENNWNWAEPGMLFWDRISHWNMLDTYDNFEYAGTNPCAEEPLPAGGSCLLGSMNLSAFVNNGKFDMISFRNAVKTAIIALNDVLDEGMPLHPLEEQRQSVRDWRQIGLGIMGLADMLINVGIKYDSQAAIELCNQIAEVMRNAAIGQSISLAKQYGTFPMYDKNNPLPDFLKDSPKELVNDLNKYGIRNSQLLTIAPTGTLSTMLGISGGIEPIFANSYTRKTQSLHGHDEYYKVYTPIVDKYMKANGITNEADLPDYFVTAQTISGYGRIAMQAIWQKYIDASISSTVNLPNNATIDDVKNLYMSAWKQGLKGLTIFRDGCNRTGVLTTDNTKEPTKNNEIPRGIIIECNDDVIGKKRKLITGCGSLHVLAFFDPDTGDMQEVYLNKGSTGGCQNYMIGLSRMISLLCRAGVTVESIKDQLDSTGTCPSYAVRKAKSGDTSKGSCCPMAIGNALIDMHNEVMSEIDIDWEHDKEKEIKDKPKIKINSKPITGKCPECGGEISYEGGCVQCHDCGWSKCG